MVKIYIKPGKEWLKPIIEDALLEGELVEEIDSDEEAKEKKRKEAETEGK